MPVLVRSRRLARLVAAWILLWLAVLQVNGWLAPVLAQPTHGHHAHAAEDCDEVDPPHGGAAHTGANHFAQCPGCLFATAPPPEVSLVAATRAPQTGVAPAPAARLLPAQAAALPPARGPPLFS